MSRYLTAFEKQTELVALESWTETANSNRNDGLDIEMIPYLKRINSLDGIVTIQSCTGHFHEPLPHSWGHLSIRLTKKGMKKFEDTVYTLSSSSFIERVSRWYQKCGQDVVHIEFISKDNNIIRFYEVMESITSYFEDILTDNGD